MASWGDFHNVTGAGWSAFWRNQQSRRQRPRTMVGRLQGKARPVARHTAARHRPLPPPCGVPDQGRLDVQGRPQSAERRRVVPRVEVTAPDSNLGHTSPWITGGEPEGGVCGGRTGVTLQAGASLAISAKFQCGWYQYLHRWEFSSDGVIEPNIAMGGALNPYAPDASHVHHMYFRIDLDIDGFQSDLFEVFEHQSFQHPSGDVWTTQANQGKFLADPKWSRKFRVRDLGERFLAGHAPWL